MGLVNLLFSRLMSQKRILELENENILILATVTDSVKLMTLLTSTLFVQFVQLRFLFSLGWSKNACVTGLTFKAKGFYCSSQE